MDKIEVFSNGKAYEMNFNEVRSHKAYIYAKDVVERKIIAGKYVIKACERFIEDVEDNNNCKFFLDTKDLILSLCLWYHS